MEKEVNATFIVIVVASLFIAILLKKTLEETIERERKNLRNITGKWTTHWYFKKQEEKFDEVRSPKKKKNFVFLEKFCVV